MPSVVKMSDITLSVIMLCLYAECYCTVLTVIMLNVDMLSVIRLCFFAERYCTGCSYVEFRYAECYLAEGG